METFYRIENINSNWQIGDVIDIGKEDNNYWKSFLEKSLFMELNGEKFDYSFIVRRASELYFKNIPPPVKMTGYHFKPLQTLNETINMLSMAHRLIRELVFESIRKEFYPELPSRQKCIWLIPDNEKSLEFWNNKLHNKHQRIFKVTVDGNIHRAAQKWLEGGTISLNNWYKLAHSYWKGESIGSIEDEILFEGKIKIIEEVIQ